MRTTSSFRLVGVAELPKNLFPAVGAGKIPALNKAVELGLIMQEGILLPGNGEPWTTPAGATPPGQLLKRTLEATCDDDGTLIGFVSELKSPPYVAGSGTI